jgi:hypothetical protein
MTPAGRTACERAIGTTQMLSRSRSPLIIIRGQIVNASVA